MIQLKKSEEESVSIINTEAAYLYFFFIILNYH